MERDSYLWLPDNLPVSENDGAADHLKGSTFPDIALVATNGEEVNLAKGSGISVLFCYPMTGVPGVPLPPGWDDIPGARGCTPQICSYRDAYPQLSKAVTSVYGISTQNTAYQKEMHDRLELPYEILSDENYYLLQALRLPFFEIVGRKLIRRITMIIRNREIIDVHYPVFPSNKDIDWVLEKLHLISG